MSAPAEAANTAREGALAAVRRGWTVFRLTIGHDEAKCDGGTASCKTLRFPDRHWSESGSDDPAVVSGWNWTRSNAYGIDCGRSGLVVVDVDPGGSWDDDETRVYSTGRGMHYVYEDMVGLPNAAALAPWGIDVRGVGGFIIGPGSYHPHGGYRLAHNRPVASAPPARLVEALAKPGRPPLRLVGDAETASGAPLDMLEACDWLESIYRRMEATPEGSRNHRLNALAAEAAGVWSRVPVGDRRGLLSEESIKERLLAAVPDDGDPAKSAGTIESGWGWGAEHPLASGEEKTEEDLRELWERVFTATPRLELVRQSAWAGGSPAPLMLGCLLARLAMEVPIGVVLPGTRDGSIGARAVLNFGVMMVADSGGTKSSAFKESRFLLATDQKHVEDIPKTGPGMEESFMSKEVDADGVRMLSANPYRLFYVDEIKQLIEDSGGTNNQLVAALCSLLMGELAGAALADPRKSRRLPDGEYRACMVIGAQTLNVGPILNDDASGTPQRMIWLPAIQREIPEEFPPPVEGLDWDDLFLMPLRDGEQHVIPVPEPILAEIRRAKWLRATGQDTVSNTSHLYLMRLKVAALLGLLHEEVGVTDQWWELAGLIVQASLAEQARCQQVLAESRRTTKVAVAKEQAELDIVRTDVISATTSRRKRIRERLPELAEDWTLQSAVRERLSRADREEFDATLPGLLAEGVLEHKQTSGTGRPGWLIKWSAE